MTDSTTTAPIRPSSRASTAYTTAMIHPWLNSDCVPTSRAAEASSVPSEMTGPDQREANENGMSAVRRIRMILADDGADRSGTPRSRVWSAFAWTSTPDIGVLDADVTKTSFSTGAVTPTRTVLPANSLAGTAPLT